MRDEIKHVVERSSDGDAWYEVETFKDDPASYALALKATQGHRVTSRTSYHRVVLVQVMDVLPPLNGGK